MYSSALSAGEHICHGMLYPEVRSRSSAILCMCMLSYSSKVRYCFCHASRAFSAIKLICSSKLFEMLLPMPQNIEYHMPSSRPYVRNLLMQMQVLCGRPKISEYPAASKGYQLCPFCYRVELVSKENCVGNCMDAERPNGSISSIGSKGSSSCETPP